ncbi:autophagy protein 12-like [Zootermopsis nevadensis]|uniref:Ubiquitin-like protein ATG12 n=1 Tax=Zootermopsis nevadensis TaxID=136037 RepID=A0A067RJ81_ZOONE|nr:autophagy protein 12-like [Zootermopsis nevadensis]KDR19407.1 Autophagy protein 12-like [Zootermopsis nevadensis]
MSGNQDTQKSDNPDVSETGSDAGEPPNESQQADSTVAEGTKSDKQKIDILLKATGNAPIMKKKKWAVDPERKIGWITEFMKKYLKLDRSEYLFLYVNQSFAPAPDHIVKNLYDCYGTDGKLVLHYCKSQAWG